MGKSVVVGFPGFSVAVGFEGLFVGFVGYSVVVGLVCGISVVVGLVGGASVVVGLVGGASVVVGFIVVGLSLVIGLTGGLVGSAAHSVVVDCGTPSVDVVIGVVGFSVGFVVDGDGASV